MPIGGVESWLDSICGALDPERWEPVVALVRGMEAHRPEAYREAHPDLETVEIDGRGLPREGRVREVQRVVREVDPDLFVPLTVGDADEAIRRLKDERCRTRYLLSVHGNDLVQLADAALSVGHADLAACPGRLTCRVLAWAGMPRERIRHTPHGVRLGDRPERPVREGPLRLAYVGRLTQEDKQVLDLIPLCRHLEAAELPYTLEIVGEGPEGARLRDELAPLIDAGRVRMHGRLSLDHLHERIYPELDILLLFSPAEAFGRVLIEAMKHGVVPVSSRFRGCEAEGVLEPGRNALLFEVGATEEAAERILALHEDRGELARLARNGRRHVEERYGWDAWLERWEDAFTAALELPERVPSRSSPSPAPAVAGRLDRMGVPPGLVHTLRRSRRRLFGVPDAMAGGEEWPWIYDDFGPERIQEIEAAVERLDVREEP